MKKFDKVYNHYNNFMKFFNLNKMKEIKDALELRGNEIVVDIGGGTGTLAEYISSECQVVYVLDESKGMLSKVKVNKKVVPMIGDALNTAFHSESVDVVIIADILHHVKEQQNLINEIYRILKAGGTLLILDFEVEHIKTKLLRAFETILFGKLFFRTSQEVIKLVGKKIKITKFIDNKYYFIIRGEKNA